MRRHHARTDFFAWISLMFLRDSNMGSVAGQPIAAGRRGVGLVGASGSGASPAEAGKRTREAQLPVPGPGPAGM